jgi:hypothetical protein
MKQGISCHKQGEGIWHILGKRVGQASVDPARDRLRLGSKFCLSFLLFTALFFCRLPLCYGAWLGPLSDAWSRTDRYLATFDPAGRYVRQPIERTVPALTFKGFFRQWTDINLHRNQKVGSRNKDFRFMQMQNLMELELHYQISPNLEITNVNHFLYDGVYNWQDSGGLFAPETSETARSYHSFERIVRELYASYRTHSFDLVLGKQQISWGKMDGRFIDMINPMDVREVVQVDSGDFEWRRLPTWMVNTTYFWRANSLQFLYIPNFEQDRGPVLGNPWFPPGGDFEIQDNGIVAPAGTIVRKRKRPSAGDFGDHEYGVRLDVSMEPLTWGLIYFYAWNDNPNFFITGVNPLGQPIFTPRHTRLHHMGVTADYATALSGVPILGELPMVLRIEGLLSTGVKFADSKRQAAAFAGGQDGGVVSRETLRGAISAEFALPGNTSVIFQPSFFYTFGWRPSLVGGGFGGATASNELSFFPVFFVGRPFRFTRDRLRISDTVVPVYSWPNNDFEGISNELTFTYQFSQFITGRVRYSTYDGGGRDELFGQYNKWDNIGWEVSYEF